MYKLLILICGLLSTIESVFLEITNSSCNQVTTEKQAWFNSSDYSPAVTYCRYEIKLRNINICQVRLDFEKLILAGTQSYIIPSNTLEEIHHQQYSEKLSDDKYVEYCDTDKLKIKPNNYGIPKVLCGNNNGQHVYIHINQTEESISAVTIEIDLTSRIDNADLLTPLWSIKSNQLECPTLMSQTHYKPSDLIADDFSILAPLGVIQYHTEPFGEIRSFGYASDASDTNSGSYPFYEKYVIGIRRSNDACAIHFNSEYLMLPINGTSRECVHYLHTPEPSNGEMCRSAYTPEFYSTVPGPFLLYFNAMTDLYGTRSLTLGFHLNYTVLLICPSLNNF